MGKKNVLFDYFFLGLDNKLRIVLLITMVKEMFCYGTLNSFYENMRSRHRFRFYEVTRRLS